VLQNGLKAEKQFEWQLLMKQETIYVHFIKVFGFHFVTVYGNCGLTLFSLDLQHLGLSTKYKTFETIFSLSHSILWFIFL